MLLNDFVNVHFHVRFKKARISIMYKYAAIVALARIIYNAI